MPILAGNTGLIGEVIQSFLKAWKMKTKLKIKQRKEVMILAKEPLQMASIVSPPSHGTQSGL